MLFYRRATVLFGAVILLTAGVAFAKQKKTDKILKQAAEAAQASDYERALALYIGAGQIDPGNALAEIGEKSTRARLSRVYTDRGRTARQTGDLRAALGWFDKAIATDASNSAAAQEAASATKALAGAGRSESSMTDAELEQARAEQRVAALKEPPQLRAVATPMSSLRMNNQPVRILYDTVAKLAGVNVVFDPQFQTQGKNYNLDLSNSTLDEALDYLAVVSHTFWKPLSSNTILVTEDNPTKRRDYEDQVVKVFYIKNCASVQEFQEIATAVRSITEMRRVFTYNAQNAIIVRGTPDQVGLAEKLFMDLDKQKAEVVVDISVLEANRARTRELALALTQGSTVGLQIAVAPVSVPSTTSTTSTVSASTTGSAIALQRLGHLSSNDYAVTLPGALLKAVMSDSRTRIIQSPQVRASDGQKAILKIGDKVPFATGSYSSLATSSVNPLVGTQFNYADVGVNVEITPRVHRDEVTLHIAVEISSVSRYVDIGGLQQPVISQRRNETDVRLRNGEVSILGGLTQSQDTKSLSGIPGLVNIPGLGGVLGGSVSTDKERGELLIALTPHIVRTPDITAADLRGIAAGSDQVVKLSAQPLAEQSVAPAPEAPSGAPAAPLSLKPSTLAVPAGRAFEAALAGTGQVQLKWDPAQVRLERADPLGGPLVVDIRNDKGEAILSSGSDAELKTTLRFVAIKPGSAVVEATAAQAAAKMTVTIGG